jgi:hypothetical protein
MTQVKPGQTARIRKHGDGADFRVRVAPMTPAERKAAERQRRAEEGLVKVEVWIDPSQRERLAKYIEKLARERG